MTEQDVRDLHVQWSAQNPVCREDAQRYPCRTIQALNSQVGPDDGNTGIVPPYLLRRIEADRRYPPEDGPYPGEDRNAPLRAAFIAGAEWEDERPKVPGLHGPETSASPTPDWEAGTNRGSG
jgi:hypothetical protein